MKKIKSINQFLSTIQNDELTDKQLINVQEFDTETQLIRELKYQDGSLIHEIIQTYHNEFIETYYEMDHIDQLETKKKFIYENGKLIKSIEYFNEDDFIETLFTYNESGDLIQERRIDNEGESHGYVEISYDSVNHLKTEFHYNEFDELVKKITTVTNDNGKTTELMNEDIDEHIHKITSSIYTYNEKNDLLTIDRFTDGVKTEEIKNTYNDKGFLVKQTVHSFETGEDREIVLEYNDEGKHITSELFINGEHKFTDEYVYDEYGNITQHKEHHFIDDEHTNSSIIFSEYSYYE